MENIHNVLLVNNLSPNELFLLWIIQNKETLCKMNTHLEVRNLIAEGYLDDSLNVTQRGLVLLNELNNTKKKTKVPAQLSADNIDEKVKLYISMWPQRVLPSGKPARVSARVIKDSFKVFFSNYEYSWETILAATQLYLDKQERDNYRMCRTSQYFIVKTTPEKIKEFVLADYCELVLAGGNEDENYFQEKVV